MKQTVKIISIDPLADGAHEAEEELTTAEERSFQLSTTEHGMRLDRVLAEHVVPEFSRSYVQQLVEAACVHLNAAVCSKPAQKVKAGDTLRITLRPTPQSQAFKPEPMGLNVVYEDDALLVINKPAGLVVHPAPGHWSGTLLNGLLAHHPDFQQVPRAGIVHRLDKDTSGLMVVARTREVMDILVRQIAERQVSRQYLAVGKGSWTGASPRTVNAPIGRDPRNRLRMAVVDLALHSGKTAQTDFVCLDRVHTSSLLQCILHTGRTHQIRVHAASLGHMLLGDAVYGGPLDAGIERQALHAFHLAFAHPLSHEALSFAAPLPPDFTALLAQQGLLYNAKNLALC